ncbi:MAG: hypothetical protein PUD59_03770 [bacterium]|nr:hypothetical protein [bacterium]
MYDEEEKSFSLRKILLTLILIIVFIILLIWLIPKFNLNGLKNRVFNDNLREMKDAAINYYTTEKLPQNEGDSSTLTLQEMLDMKLLVPFTDKNGKSCDTKNSYVTITKTKDEYELKVYLKCNEDEDYIIVHLGCYSYCEQAICESKDESPNLNKTSSSSNSSRPSKNTGKVSCELMVSKGSKGTNGWYTSDVVVSFKSKNTTTKGAKITNYGIGTTPTYDNKNSYNIKNDGVSTIYGYVKDSEGKTSICSIVIKKDSEKPNCSLDVLSGTKNSEGYISDIKVGFDSRVDNVSGIDTYGVYNTSKANYNKKTGYLVTDYGTTKVYGYLKDKAGNTAVCSKEVKKIKVPDNKYSEPSCNLSVTSGTLGNNNWYTSNVVVGFKSKTTTNGASITSYGLGTKETYDNNGSYKISSDGYKTIYGYVKDSKGNTAVCSIAIKRDATKPNCSLNVTNGVLKNDYYVSDVTVGFKSKSDAMSGINSYGLGTTLNYKNNTSYKITTNGTHTIYGYVKDNAGNTNICNIKVTKKDIEYEYEYKKTWSDKYSDWSDWTTKTYDPSNPPKFETTDTKITEDLGSKKVQDGYKYSVGDAIYGTVLKESASIKEKVCSGFDYYRTSNNTTTYAISTTSTGEWKFLKYIYTKVKPADTLSVKYVLYDTAWDKCEDACTSTDMLIFKVYTREVGTVTSNNTVKNSSGIEVKCASYETKTTYSFSTYTTIIGYKELRTPIYKTVYSYRYKTRTLLQKAGSSIKWSAVMNDTSLISEGYKMTGNKREKE